MESGRAGAGEDVERPRLKTDAALGQMGKQQKEEAGPTVARSLPGRRRRDIAHTGQAAEARAHFGQKLSGTWEVLDLIGRLNFLEWKAIVTGPSVTASQS